jgi:hypothetical protein
MMGYSLRHRLPARSLLLLCGLSLWASACSSNTRSGTTFSFDRPEYVEQACLDGNTSDPLPMACCSPSENAEPGNGDPAYLFPTDAGTPLGMACAGKERPR